MDSQHQKRIVILDRDGVINEDSPHYIKTPDEWLPIPGSLEAIALLHQQGYKIYIATNQAGVARGKLTVDALNAIHDKLIRAVEQTGGKISGIQYCPHHPDEQCGCRTPGFSNVSPADRRSGMRQEPRGKSNGRYIRFAAFAS